MNFEVGKYYKTRVGAKMRCLATDRPGDFPIILMAENGKIIMVSKTGSYRWTDNEDIISEWKEPLKISGWVNVCPRAALAFHTSRENADESAASDRIACVYVEGVEGKEPE